MVQKKKKPTGRNWSMRKKQSKSLTWIAKIKYFKVNAKNKNETDRVKKLNGSRVQKHCIKPFSTAI